MPVAFEYSQRWFEGRTNFRLSREPLNPALYGVEEVGYAQAKAFVTRHHYSGTFPPSIQSIGLFRKEDPRSTAELAGVATFSPASNPNSIARWTGLRNPAGAELGRFVLLDVCPGNSESFFLAAALSQFRAAHPEKQVVLSYSDPVPRLTERGDYVFPGHHGSIYQSTNALYLGRASSKTLFINKEGRVIANRILSKLRNGEVGRRYAERLLTEVSGVARELEEPVDAYVRRALGSLRRQPHRGNHLYVFPLGSARQRRGIKNLPLLQAHALGVTCYPKRPDVLAA